MVSIVITAYNVENYLEKCVRSSFQEGVREIIIVVDKPTDNTLEVAKKMKKEDTRVRVIENEVNVGAGLSRRYGINEATSEYVLLLDGDDFIDDGYISTLLNRAKKTDADIVTGGIRIIYPDGTYTNETYGDATTTENDDKISRFWKNRIVFMVNRIIRRSLYEKVPYCHRRYIEDTPTIIPLLWYANKVEYVDIIGYNYIMRDTSLTHTTNVLKNTIYQGLCWLDLMDFFNEHDKQIGEIINIKGSLLDIISTFNGIINITQEDIEPYKDDWIEFTTRMINLIVVNDITFKFEIDIFNKNDCTK